MGVIEYKKKCANLGHFQKQVAVARPLFLTETKKKHEISINGGKGAYCLLTEVALKSLERWSHGIYGEVGGAAALALLWCSSLFFSSQIHQMLMHLIFSNLLLGKTHGQSSVIIT